METLRMFGRNKLGIVGLVLVALIVFGSLFGPSIRPVADEASMDRVSEGPSAEFPLGTNFQGLDNFSLLLAGGKVRDDITILHCNTEYPTPMEDVNLLAMLTMGRTFGTAVGYSDHTLGIEVPIAAVAMGAVCIEKHFTLSRDLPGPDHRASLEPTELADMVRAIRNIELAMGDGIKQASASELKNKDIARKSIHLAKDLPEWHELTEADLVMKRPGTGISPMDMDVVVGRYLVSTLPADHLLEWNDIF